MVEYPQHLKGKKILSTLLEGLGYKIIVEFVMPTIQTVFGPRTYILDILAMKDGILYDFEVDGFKGHSTKKDFQKMRLRDAVIWQKYRIVTIRIHTSDLVGRKKQPIELIIQEIRHQIKSGLPKSTQK